MKLASAIKDLLEDGRLLLAPDDGGGDGGANEGAEIEDGGEDAAEDAGAEALDDLLAADEAEDADDAEDEDDEESAKIAALVEKSPEMAERLAKLREAHAAREAKRAEEAAKPTADQQKAADLLARAKLREEFPEYAEELDRLEKEEAAAAAAATPDAPVIDEAREAEISEAQQAEYREELARVEGVFQQVKAERDAAAREYHAANDRLEARVSARAASFRAELQEDGLPDARISALVNQAAADIRAAEKASLDALAIRWARANDLIEKGDPASNMPALGAYLERVNQLKSEVEAIPLFAKHPTLYIAMRVGQTKDGKPLAKEMCFPPNATAGERLAHFKSVLAAMFKRGGTAAAPKPNAPKTTSGNPELVKRLKAMKGIKPGRQPAAVVPVRGGKGGPIGPSAGSKAEKDPGVRAAMQELKSHYGG